MIQYRITFERPATGTQPPPNCSNTGATLDITLDDGVPKLGGNTIEYIEIYVSGADTGPVTIVAEDGPSDDHIEEASHVSVPPSDRGGCSWARNATSGRLLFEFVLPTANNTAQQWVFNPWTPGVKLTVKIKRQQDANTGSCDAWPAIVVQPPDPVAGMRSR